MRKNKMSGVQIKVMLLVVGISMCLMGVGYASWTDQLYVQTKASTGTMAFSVVEKKMTISEGVAEKINDLKTADVKWVKRSEIETGMRDFASESSEAIMQTIKVDEGLDLDEFLQGNTYIEVTYALESLNEKSIQPAYPIYEEFNSELVVEIDTEALAAGSRTSEVFIPFELQGEFMEHVVKDEVMVKKESYPVTVYHQLLDKENGSLVIISQKKDSQDIKMIRNEITYTSEMPIEYLGAIEMPITYTLDIPLVFEQFNYQKNDK